VEWRRLFSEAWGTFLLVLVAAGAPVVGALPAGSGLSLSAKVVAPGVMVMAIIYFMGTVSGAHLNPAVTWAFALRGDFPWKRVPGYVLAQAVGGFAAAAFLAGVFGGISARWCRGPRRSLIERMWSRGGVGRVEAAWDGSLLGVVSCVGVTGI
jgi:aquaporin Z